MSLRTSFQKFIHRDPTASLRERAAELRGTLSRRTVVAGSLAVAAPLPAISAPIVATPAQPHPDAALVALGERWLRAHDAQERALEEWGVAYQQVYAVIVTCPPELFATRDEQIRVLGGWRWPTLLGVSLRHVALDWGTEKAHTERAWTGEALRIAIARAVPMLGRGGKTPSLIRRWKALLPIADAFDTRVETVESATDLQRLEQARRAAEDERRELNRQIERCVATTPEGLAALVRVIGLYPWKDTGGAWPNLLRSAAHVAGIEQASLEHKYASTRSDWA